MSWFIRSKSSTSITVSAVVLFAVMLFALPCCAQTPQDKPAPDDSAKTAPVPADETPQQLLTRAWGLLTDNVHDAKHPDVRTQALSALSDLGTNARANGYIAEAMKDPDLDVRSAAIVAAGKTKAPMLIGPTQKLLNDPEPQVVFLAATTLWSSFKDHHGEDILAAVAAGERKASPTLIHGAEHTMSKTMHSPTALATIGAEQGAGMLLGPFGFSIGAIEYMRKNGADTARVQAVNLLAEEKTAAVREELMKGLMDKDPGVRAAAAKALGDYRSHAYAAQIGMLIDDAKLPVRLTASAAYIKSMGGAPTKTSRR